MPVNNFEQLRAERRNYKRELQSIGTRIDTMLQTFTSDDGNELVTWEDLRGSLLYEIHEVNDKVSFIPVKLEDDELVFITIVEPNGEFGTQKHDINEYCKILKGHLIEVLDDDKEYTVGEIANYNAYKRHKPKAKIYSIYLVKFKRN